MLTCAMMCIDVNMLDDGSFKFGEHKIVGYDKECMNSLI